MSDCGKIGRVSIRIVGALACLLALSGCFRPMYGQQPGGGVPVADRLMAVKVEPVMSATSIRYDASGHSEGRIQHYLAGELRFLLTGGGAEVASRYSVSVEARTETKTATISRRGTATDGVVNVRVVFKLQETATGREIVQGTVFTSAAFMRSSNRFASLRAARDAEIRSAKDLARLIHLRLAIAMSDVRS